MEQGASLLDGVIKSLENLLDNLVEARQSEAHSSRSHRNDFLHAQVPQQLSSAESAKSLYMHRRLRDELFRDPEIFGEPAWDIMLDLFVAASEQRKISVSSACIAASVPPSTALRWITILERKGWVLRSADLADGRRSFLGLTSAGLTLMETYLKRARSREL